MWSLVAAVLALCKVQQYEVYVGDCGGGILPHMAQTLLYHVFATLWGICAGGGVRDPRHSFACLGRHVNMNVPCGFVRHP